jgi:hypothetical protein
MSTSKGFLVVGTGLVKVPTEELTRMFAVMLVTARSPNVSS